MIKFNIELNKMLCDTWKHLTSSNQNQTYKISNTHTHEKLMNLTLTTPYHLRAPSSLDS